MTEHIESLTDDELNNLIEEYDEDCAYYNDCSLCSHSTFDVDADCYSCKFRDLAFERHKRRKFLEYKEEVSQLEQTKGCSESNNYKNYGAYVRGVI